jgi:hypothetical protein
MTMRRCEVRSDWLLSIVISLCVAFALSANVAPARAGTYDVHACDPSFGNGTPSWTGSETAGLTAYSSCPGGTEGIVARSIAQQNATSPGFSNAVAEFDAPAGDTVDSIHAYMELSRPGCNWSAGVYASNGTLGAAHLVFGLQSGYCGTDAMDWTYLDWAVNANNVMVAVACGASSCDRSTETRSAIKDVRVTVNDPTAPSISNPHGSMWADGAWLAGAQDIAFDASDGSGISRNEIDVDGSAVAGGNHGCDFTQRAPCPNGGLSAQIDTSKITPDGPHQLTLETIDTAGNPATMSKTIDVDNTPPAAPSSPAISGGDGWRTGNGFSVSWTNPPADAGAPVAAALYSMCPSDGGSCVTGTIAGSRVSSISNLKVPSSGDWALTVWLRDAAGNATSSNAAGPVHLRFDDGAPSVAFEPRNLSDPTLVSAVASDDVSGIASAKIEIRRHGSNSWQDLPSSYDGSRLTARVDDAHLASGPYDLQAWVVDAAGNERSTQQLAGGGVARLRLPLRVRTRIVAGAAMHRLRHPRRTWRPRVGVRFGKATRLVGRLATADGNPVAGSQVLVFVRERKTGAAWTPAASLTTSRRGYFAYRVPPGPSRVIQFRFGGTKTIQPSIRKVAVLVRARSTIHVDHHLVLNGEYIHLRGALAGGQIPSDGKLVALQALVRGEWRTFGTTRTLSSGKWRYEYRFDGTRGTQSYRLRALIPSESDYPYALGYSHGITVRVRGL